MTAMPATEYEAVIGLEVHCQLSTETKIFCACRARLPEGRSVGDEAANANTCEICAAHPGTLPVLNRKAVEYAVMAGLGTNCAIQPKSVFARKNYFYPDLPKGYQISQYDLPLCTNGYIEVIGSSGDSRKIRIARIHMEEDAGKSVHMEGYSLVNLNRAGVPLIEIVSAPDLRDAREASAYLRALYAIVTYLGICDGNLQEGNFRCDANVSVRPRGSNTLGTRAEIKNINSFRFVERAIDYEVARQIEVLRAGGRVVQETRLFDSSRGVTQSMRSKEDAQDYRYFPDPDLIPLRLNPDWIETLRKNLPELPMQMQARLVRDFELSRQDAEALTASRAMARFFIEAMGHSAVQGIQKSNPARGAFLAKTAANLLLGEISRLVNDEGIEIHRSRLTPGHLANAVAALERAEISSTGAKQLISEAWSTGDSAESIIARKGLKQVSDAGVLEPAIDQVLAANPGPVAQYKAGDAAAKGKLIGFFVGQIMKATQGKSNPSLAQEILKKKLSENQE